MMAILHRHIASFLVWTVLLGTLGRTEAHSTFRDLIPNGHKVPHPCNPLNIKWRGVGHLAEGGGGDRNPFGLDFYAANKAWTTELCQKDSDRDGKSNGEELGDPGCTWTVGTQLTTSPTSHPGFCDPIDSDACVGRLPERFCDNVEFVCPALTEDGVVDFPVHFPVTPVPAKETTYKCMQFEFPTDQDYHMTAFVEHIDNINVMHHMTLYGCEDENANPNPLNTPYDCFMSGGTQCETVLGVWALGLHGYCFHPSAGIKVGKTGFKRGVLELHWNNPMETATYTDSSGFNIYLNPNLRQYEAGILQVGPSFLNIPPGEQSHTESGFCTADCTRKTWRGPIQAVSVFNHMHYLGKQAVSKVIRNDRVDYLGYDTVYDYDKPVMHQFSEPITINPGDRIQVDCTFNSETKTKTTGWGFDTSAEMCYAIITYYPRENSDRGCDSFLDLDLCEEDADVINGCNITALADESNLANIQRITDIYGNCAVGYCKKECMTVIKRIYKDPCFSPNLIRLQIAYTPPDSCETNQYFALLTSCDKEIYKEQELERRANEKDEEINTAMTPVVDVIMLAAMLFYQLLM